MGILILSDADVHRALSPEACEQAMAAVLAAHARGEAYVPLRTVMVPPGAPGFMGLMPGYAAGGEPGGSFAVKSICLMPGNPLRGLDTHQGTVTLFSGETGVPVAILNASAVTEIRTAAVTAAATRVLAAPDARVLAVLGAGVQGRSHLHALKGVRDWDEVRIYSPSAGHAQAAAEAARARGDSVVMVAASAREAIEGADVVVTATSAREPVLEHGWLRPGAHVNAVGASTPSAWEIDVATVAAAALFCDNRDSLAHEAGEFRRALQQGAIAGPGHVRAELGEVLAGLAPGRSDGELTMFRSLGVGIEDLAAAQLALATAREHGIGTEVEL
jgi:ornithine cyclodeaminase/alanine dehydrogenase-like protein (mu-crystallin family)